MRLIDQVMDRRTVIDVVVGGEPQVGHCLEEPVHGRLVDNGAIVADGPTAVLLGDEALMTAARLELPFGFDTALLA